MDGDSLLLVALFLICLVFSGYFSASESSFARMNKIRAKTKADNGDKKAKNALYVSNNYEKAITAILIGNNIVNIAAAAIATLLVSRWFADADPGTTTLITTFGATAIVFIFGEMLPKTFANDRPDTMAYFSAGILRLIMTVLKPFIALFSLVTNAVSRIFKSQKTPSITEEDLYELIEKAEEQGIMDEEQSDMMKSALDFQEKTAADVMTPRDKINCISINLSKKEIADIVKTASHSRIPMINGSLDRIVGILPVRKYLREYISDKSFEIKSVLSKPYYVKSTESIQELLDNMSCHKKSLAIVRDEKKKVIGLITIEDILEELVGEIWDEEDLPLSQETAKEVMK